MNKQEEYDWNGLAIGDDVTLLDKRTAVINDIYDKDDRLLAQVTLDNGFVLMGVPLKNLSAA